MKKIFLILFFFPLVFLSQQNKIDSLERELNKATADTIKVKTLLGLGWTYRLSSPDKGIRYSQDALTLSQKINYQYGTATSHINLGIIYSQQSKFEKALNEYELSLKIFSQIRNKKGIGMTYANMANTYNVKGDLSVAIKYNIISLKLFEECGYRKGLAAGYSILGNLYTKLKNFDKALESFNFHLKIKEEEKDKYSVIEPLTQISYVYLNMKKYPEAHNVIFRAKKLCEESGNSLGLSILLNQMGAIYYEQKKIPEAIESYNQCLQLGQKVGDKRGTCIAMYALGDVYIEIKDFNKALQYYKKSFETARQIEAKEEMSEALFGLSLAYEKKGNLSEALRYYKLYSDIKDSLLNKDITGQITEISTRYETEKKENKIKLLNKEAELLKAETARKEAEFISFRNNIIIGSALFLIIFSGIFLYIRNKRTTEKIKMEKQVAELEHQALRLQMNPHFIFNSLSSINNFIGKNEAAEAKKFLTKFAKLMRLILENSREEFITIQKEIDSLQYYFELEQLRFNSKFIFEIITAENIDTENDLIPPMFIQPHVENAILHGIAPKNSSGKISVSFTKKNGSIACEVWDNGIGRKKAGEIKNEKGLRHKSLAIAVTQDRLNILNASGESESAICIEDLESNDGTPLGTKVKFNIPLKQKI